MEEPTLGYRIYRGDIERRLGIELSQTQFEVLSAIAQYELESYVDGELRHWVETLLPKWMEDEYWNPDKS
jgi:hypothetical protein